MRPVPSRRRPADFVRVSLGEPRVARMWSAVAAAEQARGGRPAAPGYRRRAMALLAVAAMIGAFLVGLRLRPAPAPALGGLVIDSGAATQEVSLTEGSSLHLSPATRLVVIAATASEIRLRLERGGVTCDVVHRETRRFVVEAAGVEVEDRGTRFAVEVRPGEGRPDAVAVRVEHGAVEVRDRSAAVVATLSPGQAWTSGSPEAQRTPPPGPPVTAEESPPVAPSAEPPAPPASAAAASPRGGGLSPQALFERADAARLAGRHAEAAAELERFRRRFPGDPRAGLAAYELGRIRLGSLHDPRGAAEAFDAVLERPDDPFREDAEAGRVEALADLGDDAACRRARDAFQARHPRSPLAGRVARLCGASSTVRPPAPALPRTLSTVGPQAAPPPGLLRSP